MPIHNSDIARIFNRVADLLDIEGANQFRVRAYRDAAGTISRLSRSVANMVAAGEDLSELPNIGTDLAAKIEEIVRTGTLEQLAEIEQRTPPELADLLDIEGLGPKRVRKLHEELDIVTIEELEQAARAGKIRQLDGFGETLEQDILDEIGGHPGRWNVSIAGPGATTARSDRLRDTLESRLIGGEADRACDSGYGQSVFQHIRASDGPASRATPAVRY